MLIMKLIPIPHFRDFKHVRERGLFFTPPLKEARLTTIQSDYAPNLKEPK